MHTVEIFIFCSAVLGTSGELTLTERDAAKWASSPFENDTSIRPFTVTFSENVSMVTFSRYALRIVIRYKDKEQDLKINIFFTEHKIIKICTRRAQNVRDKLIFISFLSP